MIKTIPQIKEEAKNFKFWNYQIILGLIFVCISWAFWFFLIGVYVGLKIN